MGAALVLAAVLSGIPAQAQTKSIRLRNEFIVTPPSAQHGTGGGGGGGTSVAPAGNTLPAQPRRLTGLYLIQFESRLQPAWRDALRTLGVELVHYVPDDAFVARLTNAAADAIVGLEYVRWLNPFQPGHKVLGSLDRRARELATKPGPVQDVLEVKVLTVPGATPADLLAARRSFGRVDGQTSGRYGTILRGRIAPSQLPALAGSDAVLWIEPAPQFHLTDEISSKIIAGDGGPGQLFTQGLGYDGAGVTVAVADSGLDSGDSTAMHPDLAGRVAGLFFYGNLTDASDEHSHGTHVAGIIGGNGAVGEVDETGALYGLGVAPGVSIVAQRIFDGAGGYEPPASFEALTRDAVRAGAEIGSNSWGDDTQGRYDLSAMEFDALVRDADGLAFGDQPYILEFSAGNAGPGVQTVGSPAVAKNVIATGASVNNRFNLPLEEFAIYNTGQETMADFSSRGPCEDGRIKPDLVAPGTWISSLRSVYANDDNAWWPISDAYLYQGGTSQAGPGVSGAAAVLVQYWREAHTNQTPSPALVKALLINSATDMDNDVETAPVPNHDEGWGRVNLPGLIDSSGQMESVDQTVRLTTGQVSERRVLVESPDEPLKITLTYTDVPGFPAAVPALVNDLDLEVVAPDGTIYRGNQIESGESVPNAPLADRLNNVEAVRLGAPLPGEYVVRVRAQAVVQDARLDSPEIDQDFALAISGLLARPGTGIVAFDRRAYTVPATIRLTLFEQDLAGQATATVTLRSGQEPTGERVTLHASGASGVFTASVATATGPPLPNGRLEVQHNTFIEAVYEDASPAATRRYFSRADLQPPVISGVSSRFEFGQEIVEWSTDEEASSLFRYGTGATPDHVVTNRFFDVAHEVRLSGLTPDALHRFDLVAEDAAGNRSTNNNAGAYFTFTPQSAPTVLLVDAYSNDLFDVPPLSGYTQPLDQLGMAYDVWDVSADGPITAASLAPYRVVMWRISEFSMGTTFSTSDAAAVTAYLATGGSFFLSSMEGTSRMDADGVGAFARDVLGVQSYTEDTGVPAIAGAGGDPIGSGINTPLDYSPYEDFIKELVGLPADASDTIVASTNASPILLSGTGVVGVRAPKTGLDRPGRTVFLSFPLDAVPLGSGIGNNRAGLLRNILGFLAPSRGSSTIALDRDAYTIPATATVEVEDPDLAGTPTVQVHASSPARPAGLDVTITATTRPGLFRGTLALAAPGQPPEGPALVVESGQAFQVDYVDASAGETRTATAVVETTPPVISQVSIDASYTEAIVSWTTSEPTDALIQYGESPDNFPVNFTAYDGVLGVSHELALTGLKPETVYYVRVISRDLAGNTTTDDNQGQFHRFTTLRPIYTPWFDDGEQGDADWTVVTAEESELAWELGVPANGVTAASPDKAWGTNLRGQSADIGETVLLSPGIYLTGGSRIALKFLQNYDFLPSDDPNGFEYGTVELYTNLNTAAIPLAVTSDSSIGEWDEMEVDLTAYRGQLVYLAWHYVLFSFDVSQRLGWMLDDISITATNIPTGTITVTNNIWQARFVMAGPSGKQGQGASLVITNARPGTYQVAFGDVPYFRTPPGQTNVLDPSGAIRFEGNYVMTDQNDNGMADGWEQANFGGVSPGRTRTTDTDGDGFTDYAEFVAGTDPNQPTSYLRLNQPIRLLNGSIRFQWPTVPGRAYRLQFTPDYVRWFNVSDWTLATSTSLGQVEYPVSQPAAIAYRVEVQP